MTIMLFGLATIYLLHLRLLLMVVATGDGGSGHGGRCVCSGGGGRVERRGREGGSDSGGDGE
jgi:hypothetical protein